MQADFSLHQRSAQKVNLARLSYRAGTHEVPIKARHACFDGLTIGLHWVTVLLVIALFASAWLHAVAEAQHSGFTPTLLQIHRSLGLTVWFITAMRLVWRLLRVKSSRLASSRRSIASPSMGCSRSGVRRRPLEAGKADYDSFPRGGSIVTTPEGTFVRHFRAAQN